MKFENIQKYADELPTCMDSGRSFDELEMLAEELDRVKAWLDNEKAPLCDRCGNDLSVVDRIKKLLDDRIRRVFNEMDID